MTDATPIPTAGATPVEAPISTRTGPNVKIQHPSVERVRFAMEQRAGQDLRLPDIAAAAAVAPGTISGTIACLLRHRVVEKLDRGLYRLPPAKVRKSTHLPAPAPTAEPDAAAAPAIPGEEWRHRARPSAEVEAELTDMADENSACGCGCAEGSVQGRESRWVNAAEYLGGADCAVYAEVVTTPLKIEQRRRAITEIAKAYDAETESYQRGTSDTTLAKRLEIPVETVASLRETNFGPLRPSPIRELVEIEAELNRIGGRVATLIDRLNVARRKLLDERA